MLDPPEGHEGKCTYISFGYLWLNVERRKDRLYIGERLTSHRLEAAGEATSDWSPRYMENTVAK